MSVGKKLLFWFFVVGFKRWQKPNVQFVRLAFFQLAGNLLYHLFYARLSANIIR